MVGIIGTGRVGPSLAKVLKESGVEVSGIWGRNYEKCLDASGFAGVKPYRNLEDLVEASKVIIIAVKDDAIGHVAGSIRGKLEGKIFAHTSGSIPSSVLGSLKERGGFIGSFHPLQSFGSRESGTILVKRCYIAIEGDEEAVKVLWELARRIGAKPFRIKTEGKVLYHASAVMACNLFYGLYYLATEMLSLCGVEEDVKDKVLIPLVEGTVENIKTLGPVKALTGPVVRGDVGTVEKHLKEMEKRSLNQHVEVYKILSKILLKMARERGLDEKALKEMEKLLV